jgi:hypothetical protein
MKDKQGEEEVKEACAIEHPELYTGSICMRCMAPFRSLSECPQKEYAQPHQNQSAETMKEAIIKDLIGYLGDNVDGRATAENCFQIMKRHSAYYKKEGV